MTGTFRIFNGCFKLELRDPFPAVGAGFNFDMFPFWSIRGDEEEKGLQEKVLA